MLVRRAWTVLGLACVLVVPMLGLTQQNALAQGTPKAEWRSSKATKAAPKTKKAPAPPAGPATAASEPPALPASAVPLAAPVLDQSQEVLDVDFAMAASIAAQGPKDGYASALSDEGVLYDANGASPAGREAALSRFSTFPGDVLLVRAPERALAAGGSGSSWGTYTIKRGEMILSAGRYISVWRREAAGWKMISELAAGKTVSSPSSPPQAGVPSGVLPKRPAQLGRVAPPPVGVPLTVPTLPPTPTQAETAPTP